MKTTATNRVNCVTIYQGTLTYLVPSITCDNMHHNKSNFVGKQIQFHRKTKIDQPACGNNEHTYHQTLHASRYQKNSPAPLHQCNSTSPALLDASLCTEIMPPKSSGNQNIRPGIIWNDTC